MAMEELICAVVHQAYKDLITAYKKNDQHEIIRLEEFMLDSEWIQALPRVDGGAIINVARKRAKE